MITTRQSFWIRTAADLMTRSVVLVPKEMSLPGAARLLGQAEVSGAPVVDDEGRCIGVISAGDFLQHAKQEQHSPRICCTSVRAWQILEGADLPNERVADLMTKDPVTVPPSTEIGELARMMTDAHIHRIIVVDEQQRPIGVVSSTDILATVAEAAVRPLGVLERTKL
jgi:CBS-domain-containing membrane protein